MYTFKDWINNKLPEPKRPDGYPEWHWQSLWRETNWPKYYNIVENTLPPSEYVKIIEAQKDAYKKAIKRNAEIKLQIFEIDNKDTPPENIKSVLELEISEYQKRLTDKLLKQVKQNRIKAHFITPDIYKEMLQVEQYFKPPEHISRTDAGKLFAAHEICLIIDKLESLKAKYSLPDPTEVARKYYQTVKDKRQRYNSKDAAQVMEVTKNYLYQNSEIETIKGKVAEVKRLCCDLTGGPDAKKNWIEFYADKAGYKKL